MRAVGILPRGGVDRAPGTIGLITWTEERGHPVRTQILVGGPLICTRFHVDLAEEYRLLDERQHQTVPTHSRPRGLRSRREVDRKPSLRILIGVQPIRELLRVLLTRRPPRRLSGALNCWQQQANECRDDRDHYEKFDEREPTIDHGPCRTLDRWT